jgi:hypothetical protein
LRSKIYIVLTFSKFHLCDPALFLINIEQISWYIPRVVQSIMVVSGGSVDNGTVSFYKTIFESVDYGVVEFE